MDQKDTDFLPGAGMFIRRTSGVELSGVEVDWLRADGRPPFILSDAHNISFGDGVTCEKPAPPIGYAIGLRDGVTGLKLSGSSRSLVVRNLSAA